MGSVFKKWMVLCVVMVVNLHNVVVAEPQVPCFFIFGDSLVDNGNNNAIQSLARANYLPYGVDFPDGPTGRFSNGKTTVDVIAELLGFDDYIPPYANARGEQILRGVNYASAAAGIRSETGQQLGARIDFTGQVSNYKNTVAQVVDILGDEDTAADYLSKCIYSIGVGSNDYLNNYFMPQYYSTANQYSPDQYADALIEQYTQQLRNLNSLGSRKVVVYGLTTLGCIPEELIRYPTHGSACVDSINNGVDLYNKMVLSLLNDLNDNLVGARFIFVNLTDLSSANPSATGTRVTREACCKVGITGLCVPNGKVCSNRAEYYYWDNYHPTDFVYNIFASRAYNATTAVLKL
ncbi:hypothetical protein ACS0TY_032326 [Phlomoides rotata]